MSGRCNHDSSDGPACRQSDFGYWCSLPNRHGRRARETHARCACHIQTAPVPDFAIPVLRRADFGNKVTGYCKRAGVTLMKRSLSETSLKAITTQLHSNNVAFVSNYPGETGRRQPVHTVYGGAHLFRADSARRLGEVAQRALTENAPDFVIFARAIGLPQSHDLPDVLYYATGLKHRLETDPDAVREENRAAWLAHIIYSRVLEKLKREPVEDFRIDFEDGYGNRPDAEEDGHAESAAIEVANGIKAGTLPPFIGIRIKPFNEELYARSRRTLDIFVSTLLERTNGRLPDNFVITLPKIT